MEIRVTGHNIVVTQGMKDHLQDKLVKYERYASRLVESHVVLKKQRYIFEAEITLLAKHLKAFGDGRSKESIFAAIDKAATRVEKQLIKYRAKLKDHHRKLGPREESPLSRKVPKGAGKRRQKSPVIVPTSDFFAPKPMSVEEASMQLEIMPENFLVFRNAATQKVNVLFKKGDENHGLIEPDF